MRELRQQANKSEKQKIMIPKQEYELIKLCRQTIEGGTPTTCDDCGRLIFNIATIKGKMDGKIYSVGLSCVKKLLNKFIYFNNATLWEYERQVALWDEAFNTRKWIDKQQKAKEKHGERKYILTLKKYTSESDGKEYFYFNMQGDRKFDTGNTKSLNIEFLPLFNGIY